MGRGEDFFHFACEIHATRVTNLPLLSMGGRSTLAYVTCASLTDVGAPLYPYSMVQYRELASLCEELERTSSRLRMAEMVARFLRALDPGEVVVAVNLLVGRVFPEGDSRSLGISFRSILKVLGGMDLPQRGFDRANAEAVDGGDAVGIILEDGGRVGESPTMMEVYQLLVKIGAAKGKGSRAAKEKLLANLLSRLDPIEAKCASKNIIGEMRHGVSEGMVLEGIAKSAGLPREGVRRAYMFLGDLGEVARRALSGTGLEEVKPQLFRPFRPMLAQTADSVEEAWKLMDGRLALEYKYDGARAQIHKKGKKVRIYSRRLSDMTAAFPEIVRQMSGLGVERALLEGEVIGIDAEGVPLPFQYVMKRLTRVHEVKEARKEVPVRLRLFDCLLAGDRLLVDWPYEKRWKTLRALLPRGLLATRLVPRTVEEAVAFFEKAIEEGHEGLMAKCQTSTYTPGARRKKWLKIKLSCTVDLVILAADWGYGRRRGWLSNYHLGVLEEKTGGYAMVGKTFKGLRDEEFALMTERLLSAQVGQRGSTVYVDPQVVVEVTYNEIQRSPHYESGMALRFARITRIRPDKSATDIATLEDLREEYRRQSLRKGKLPRRESSND